MQKNYFLVALLSFSITHIHVMYSSEVQTLPTSSTSTFNLKDSPKPSQAAVLAAVQSASKRKLHFETGSFKVMHEAKKAALLAAQQ